MMAINNLATLAEDLGYDVPKEGIDVRCPRCGGQHAHIDKVASWPNPLYGEAPLAKYVMRCSCSTSERIIEEGELTCKEELISLMNF